MEWKEVEIGNLFERFSAGRSIKAANISESGSFPVYGGNGLRGYTEESNFEGDCAIIGRQGAFCGNVRYFKGAAYMTEHAIVCVANKDNNTIFLSYLLGMQDLGRYSGQSAQPGLSVSFLKKQLLAVPPLATQTRIVSILSSLDSKIETNNKINAKLEEMAQALFKSWFVDFEPFKDKGMVESELGMIPKGWRVGKLGEICCYSKQSIGVDDLNLSTYYSTENMLPNKTGVVTASSLPKVKSTTGCMKFDVIISNIRPYFKKIYRIDQPCGCSNDVMCFHPLSSEWSTYMYRVLYEDSFFNYVMSGAKGTKMPRGDKKQIMNYQIIMPEKETLLKFSNIVEPICNTIRTNQKESSRLSLLRDTLLPKLMSGEISLDSLPQ